MIFRAITNIFFSNINAVIYLLPNADSFWFQEFEAAVSSLKIYAFYYNEFFPVDHLFFAIRTLITANVSMFSAGLVWKLIRG